MSHLSEVAKALNTIPEEEIINAANLIFNSDYVFIIGNGGSLATAEHFATDLHNRGVIAITPNHVLMSAEANDVSFESIFNSWLINYEDLKNKLLIAISVSGNSQNIVNAVKCFGGKTLLITGHYGLGMAVDYAKTVISVESDKYEICEDVHSIICHAIARSINEGLSVTEKRGY